MGLTGRRKRKILCQLFTGIWWVWHDNILVWGWNARFGEKPADPWPDISWRPAERPPLYSAQVHFSPLHCSPVKYSVTYCNAVCSAQLVFLAVCVFLFVFLYFCIFAVWVFRMSAYQLVPPDPGLVLLSSPLQTKQAHWSLRNVKQAHLLLQYVSKQTDRYVMWNVHRLLYFTHSVQWRIHILNHFAYWAGHPLVKDTLSIA